MCFQNDNKLLFALISQDREEPSPTAACSLLFPYCCLSSEVSVSNYYAWNHNQLRKKKKKEEKMLYGSTLFCSFHSPFKTMLTKQSLYAVFIKALTFLMLNFHQRDSHGFFTILQHRFFNVISAEIFELQSHLVQQPVSGTLKDDSRCVCESCSHLPCEIIHIVGENIILCTDQAMK